MPELVNTNEHRIYYGENGDNIARAGTAFEGSDSDAERPGIVAADSEEGRRVLAEGAVTEGEEQYAEITELQAELGEAGTAGVRGDLAPHPVDPATAAAQQGGTVTTESGPIRGRISEPGDQGEEPEPDSEPDEG